MFNAKDFGVPQNRERLIYIGNRIGVDNGEILKRIEMVGASIASFVLSDALYGLRPLQAWVLNDSTVKALRKLKDNTGNYIWNPSVQAGVPDTILNRPYKTSSYVPELKAGNKCMAFGDFKYYWIADRQGRSFKRLNELFAMTGQVGFLASQRLDGKLILPEAVKTLAIKKAGQAMMQARQGQAALFLLQAPPQDRYASCCRLRAS